MSAAPIPAKLRGLLLHLHLRKPMSYEQNGLGTDPADLLFNTQLFLNCLNPFFANLNRLVILSDVHD